MILAVTGKTRSGKSTALHRLLLHLLREDWEQIILLDGKGSELIHYAGLERVVYYGPQDIEAWADALGAHAEGMAARYNQLVERGLREAAQGDPKTLILVDEVQKGTRAKKKLGTAVKEAVELITEQSQALHDVIVMSTQREVNAIPPSARVNVDVWLAMLGEGYFYLKPDGTARVSGRTSMITPPQVIAHLIDAQPPLSLAYENLPTILGAKPAIPGRATVTMYMGAIGSGRTHHLRAHAIRYPRVIYLDCAQTHKKILEAAIESGHAIVPPKATIPDLIEIASLAIQAVETLVLLDNLDRISEAAVPTMMRLIEVSAEVAIAARPPITDANHRKLDHFISRSLIKEIEPLSADQSRALIEQNLPESLKDREHVIRHISRIANGHPRTLVNLSMQMQTGSMTEIRELQAPATRGEPFNISWIPLLLILFGLMLFRFEQYSMAITMIVLMILRPRIMSAFRPS